MKLDSTKAICFSICLAGIVLSAPAYAAIVSVSAGSDIFAAGVTSIPGTDYAGNVGGNGMAPFAYAVTPGETLDITATGQVNCCDTASTPGVSGPNGFNPNPFAPPPGSTISNSISGGTVGTYTSSTGAAFALVGSYLNGNPFTIGSSDTIVIPNGVNTLYLGFADAAGFNGLSGYYQDNSGSLQVSISAVPEPSTWAMMISGFLGLGFMAYRRKPSARLRLV
jgi:hypothetical protein